MYKRSITESFPQPWKAYPKQPSKIIPLKLTAKVAGKKENTIFLTNKCRHLSDPQRHTVCLRNTSFTKKTLCTQPSAMRLEYLWLPQKKPKKKTLIPICDDVCMSERSCLDLQFTYSGSIPQIGTQAKNNPLGTTND